MLKRSIPLCLALSLIVIGCSDNSQSGPESRQYTKAQAVETAPTSVSGNQIQTEPNPHTALSAEQQISVAMQHAENGRMEQALDVLTRAIITTPDDADLIGTRGSLLLTQDRVFDALVDLEKAVTLAPENALLLVNRSQAYRKFNRYQEAMADLDMAITLSPKLVPAHFNRGTLLYADARYKEALADFDVCIEAAPGNAGPYFNRAITRDALDDQAGATIDMNKFIELADNPEWIKVAQETMAAWAK
ncbi:MAG: tetratricopeptide repeat protein [Candidatus Thiodiazotropha sp. LLP2]